jgi:hypothetical protein
MPRAYPLLPNWEDRAVRRRVHGNYLIFYRIGPDAVEVLHVLHRAMDYEQILLPAVDADDACEGYPAANVRASRAAAGAGENRRRGNQQQRGGDDQRRL